MAKSTKQPTPKTELSDDDLDQVQGGATDDVYVDGNIITAENYDSPYVATDGSKTRSTPATRFKKDQAIP